MPLLNKQNHRVSDSRREETLIVSQQTWIVIVVENFKENMDPTLHLHPAVMIADVLQQFNQFGRTVAIRLK